MSAFIELAKFCGDHPEIRGHKMIGELLRGVENELNDAISQQHKYLRLNVEFHNSNVKLRSELNKARILLFNAQRENEAADGNGMGAWTQGSALEGAIVEWLEVHSKDGTE